MLWQFADARDRFSELVAMALTDGPQRVNCRGQAVIVISEAEYQRLTGERGNLKDYLLNGPD